MRPGDLLVLHQRRVLCVDRTRSRIPGLEEIGTAGGTRLLEDGGTVVGGYGQEAASSCPALIRDDSHAQVERVRVVDPGHGADGLREGEVRLALVVEVFAFSLLGNRAFS